MSYASPAVTGTSFLAARSFKVAFTTSAPGSATAVAAGSYYLTATQDCDVRISTASNVVAAALGSSQPAAGSENGTLRVLAGTMVPFDVPSGTTCYVSAIGVTSSGDLALSGPIKQSANR